MDPRMKLGLVLSGIFVAGWFLLMSMRNPSEKRIKAIAEPGPPAAYKPPRAPDLSNAYVFDLEVKDEVTGEKSALAAAIKKHIVPLARPYGLEYVPGSKPGGPGLGRLLFRVEAERVRYTGKTQFYGQDVLAIPNVLRVQVQVESGTAAGTWDGVHTFGSRLDPPRDIRGGPGGVTYSVFSDERDSHVDRMVEDIARQFGRLGSLSRR